MLKYFQLRKNINETKDDTSKELKDELYDKYDLNGFNIYGKHKYTKDKYDPNGFNIDGRHKYTKDKYDPNGFDIYYIHKDTDDICDPNGFNINGKHKDTKNKYDPNGFDINGRHKDTDTFLDKKNVIREDILKNIYWLKDKGEFLKLFDEIIINGEFSEMIKKNLFHQSCLKIF